MSVIGAFLTSLTIGAGVERGTMEQLISTPVTAMEIMLGKLAPYFVTGNVRYRRQRADCNLLVRCAFSRLVGDADGGIGDVHGGGAIAGILDLRVWPKTSLQPARLRC